MMRVIWRLVWMKSLKRFDAGFDLLTSDVGFFPDTILPHFLISACAAGNVFHQRMISYFYLCLLFYWIHLSLRGLKRWL